MYVRTVICNKGHSNQVYFPNSDAFERAMKRAACETCGSKKIRAELARPNVGKGEEAAKLNDFAVQRRVAFMKYVAESENVGDRLAEVTRAMHYGNEPERPVKGFATMETAEELASEGIILNPIPTLDA